jgi:hypothetical protein
MIDRSSQPPPARPRARVASAVRPLLALAIALCASAIMAGCGNVTSGGFGDVEVQLSSDEVAEVQAAASSILAFGSLDRGGASLATPIVGTLTVRVRSFARRGVADFIELTDGAQDVTLSLSDPRPVEIARRALPAGRYDGVRTFFGRIEADIVSGLVIDGQEVTGRVLVDLGAGGALTVLTYTGFDVWEDAPTVIAIEMQSGIWLRLVNAALKRIDAEEFRRILRVRVRERVASGG